MVRPPCVSTTNAAHCLSVVTSYVTAPDSVSAAKSTRHSRDMCFATADVQLLWLDVSTSEHSRASSTDRASGSTMAKPPTLMPPLGLWLMDKGGSGDDASFQDRGGRRAGLGGGALPGLGERLVAEDDFKRQGRHRRARRALSDPSEGLASSAGVAGAGRAPSANALGPRRRMELRIEFFSLGYFFGLLLLSCGVIAPLAWTAVRRKFLKGKYYRRA